MYLAYWGLEHSPFQANFNPRFFEQAPTQEEALARLHFLVDENRSLALLLGETGVGKTFLLKTFATQLGRVGKQVALVNLTALSVEDLLCQIAGGLDLELFEPLSTTALWRAVGDHLAANRYQQLTTILLFDDADAAKAEVIAAIERLTQLDTSSSARLSIVLAARPRRVARLGLRLLELSDLRVDLDAWSRDDTAAFIKRALATAGRSTPVFSEASLARLHELSEGIPRRVKQLADLALVAGAGGNVVQIEPATIDSVCQELGAVTTDAPPAALFTSQRS
jgi:general secretion pathway protein A